MKPHRHLPLRLEAPVPTNPEPVEEELPFADLDAEVAAEQPPTLNDTEEQLQWLLSDEKK